jgi:predicted ATP-grasp superfamily ATP-dependent carboligase
VAVLQGMSRNGRGVVLALQNQGYKIICIDQNPGKQSKKIYEKHLSKYYHDFYYYNKNYLENQQAFTDEIIEIIKNADVDVLIPTCSEATIAIAAHYKEYSKNCLVATETWEKMEKLHDKFQVLEMAQKLGIPHPETRCPKSFQELEETALEIGFPIILKARRGMSSNFVYVVEDLESLKQSYLKFTSDTHSCLNDGRVVDNSRPILQEFIPGKQLYDGTVYCENGVAKLVTSQARLMTYPLDMGGGIFNKTTFNENVHEAMKKFAYEMKWNGVLEADFIYDSLENEYKLIEVNPKFWGTNYLTTAAGYNYPLYCVQQLIGKPSNFPTSYQMGLICRWPGVEIDTWFSKPCNIFTVVGRIIGFCARFAQRPQIVEPFWRLDLIVASPWKKIINKLFKRFFYND